MTSKHVYPNNWATWPGQLTLETIHHRDRQPKGMGYLEMAAARWTMPSGIQVLRQLSLLGNMGRRDIPWPFRTVLDLRGSVKGLDLGPQMYLCLL